MSPVDFISCKWNNWMVKYGEPWHQLWWKHNRNSVIASLLSSPGIHARSPHAATHSNQHRQMLRLFYPLQFFIFFLRSFNQFQRRDFSIDPICIAWLKAENQELVAEDGITATASDHWAQEITLYDLQKQLHSFGFHYSCDYRPMASGSKE